MFVFRIDSNVEENNVLLDKVDEVEQKSPNHYDQPSCGLYSHNSNSFEDIENGNVTTVSFMDETTSLSQNSILIPLTGTTPPQHQDEPFDANACKYFILITLYLYLFIFILF